MYICNALLNHGYSVFSLTTLKYINISHLSSGPGPEEVCKLILEREQYYINSLLPLYNINSITKSRLGSRHTEKTKTKMYGENNPMHGRTSANYPNFGK
jgi:group I intron endonuclease